MMEYTIDSCLDLDDWFLNNKQTKQDFIKSALNNKETLHLSPHYCFITYQFIGSPHSMFDTDLFKAEQYSWKVNESNQILSLQGHSYE